MIKNNTNYQALRVYPRLDATHLSFVSTNPAGVFPAAFVVNNGLLISTGFNSSVSYFLNYCISVRSFF